MNINKSSSGHVQLLNLSKSFNASTQALDNFSAEILPGELVVFLGPSGCGKTTALRALAGLQDVDSGRILLDGQDITQLSAARRNMAMVFQQYSLFPHLTAQENVEFGLRVRKVGTLDRKRQALEALELVGLADQAKKYTTQMSGGQQQRVALARALVIKPRVLALDEPLSALDAKVRVNLREEIRRIQRESEITTLFVTHDQEEALAIADRVAVMNKGSLVQIGSPEEIYNNPSNEFVASFIGTTNRISANIVDDHAMTLGCRLPLLHSPASRGTTTVLVRPESIGLSMVDSRESTGIGMGHVRGVSFLGSTVRVEVELPDGSTIISQVNPTEAAVLSMGDRVRLQLDPRPVLALA